MKIENGVKKGLNANQLKLIAIIVMTIDHINKIFFSSKINVNINNLLLIMGRITIPIICFFISEGYFHTKNKRKYIKRLFICASFSHFAYCYAFNYPIIQKTIFFETSVIWSLLGGLIALIIIKSEKLNKILKGILIFVIFCLVINSDWGIFAVALILILGLTRENKKNQMLGMVIVSISYITWKHILDHDFIQTIRYMGLFLAIPFLVNYNGEKGKCKWLKWFFYIYYPAHLIILKIIRNLILI